MYRMLLPVFAFLTLFSFRLSFGLQTSNSTTTADVEQVRFLKYGDNCSWEAEQFRQQFIKDNMFSSKSQEEQVNVVAKLEEAASQRNYSLCSGVELFICDKESQKCVCGDPGHEALMGVDRSLYILENNTNCRWAANSYCIVDEEQDQISLTMANNGSDPAGSKCKTGTTCKTGDGELCTLGAFKKQLIRKEGQSLFYNLRRIMEELMSGKNCACKED